MKRFILVFMAVAAVSLTSCKKNNDNKPVVPEEPKTVEWGGATYNIVKMGDGRFWLAEPLRYVPKGKTASDNPNDDSGFWYPYKSDGTKCTPLKDEASIKELGYLYDYETALGGVKLNKDNFMSFEGAQGICPDGWHIPTRTELIALCGFSIKKAGEADKVVNEQAAYYDAEYKGAKVTALDAAGFKWNFSGTVARNSSTLKGSYVNNIISETNSTVSGYFGKNALTYIMSSTGDSVGKDKAGNINNYKFFGMMTAFKKPATPEGKLSVLYTNYKSGYSIRCIKNL